MSPSKRRAWWCLAAVFPCAVAVVVMSQWVDRRDGALDGDLVVSGSGADPQLHGIGTSVGNEPADARQSGGGPGQIRGQVLSRRTLVPVRGARVRVYLRLEGLGRGRDIDPVSSCSSDRNGRFELPGLATGTYDLEVSHTLFARLDQQIVSLPASAATQDVGALLLASPRSVEGTVRGRAGLPVSDAQVVLGRHERTLPFAASSMPLSIAKSSRTKTDERGRFAFARLDAGHYRVLILSPSYASRSDHVFVPSEGKATISVQLSPATLLGGQVVDERGRSVDNATLSVTLLEPRSLGTESFPSSAHRWSTIATDSTGAWLVDNLPDLPNLTVAIHVRHPDYRPLDTTDVISGKTDHVLRLVAKQRVEGLDIFGFVSDAIRSPLTGVSGVVRVLGSSDGTARVATQSGQFVLRNVALGRQRVRVAMNGYLPTTLAVEVSRDLGSLHVRVQRGMTIVGTVLDAHTRKPIAGARVMRAGERPGVATDERGRYELGGFEAGAHFSDLSVTASGYFPLLVSYDAPPRTTTLRQEHALVSVRDGAVVRGVARLPGGDPAAGAELELIVRQQHSEFVERRSGRAGVDGAFSLSPVRPLDATKTVSLHVRHAGAAPLRLEWTGADTLLPLDLEMVDGRTLSGLAVDEHGGPIAGAVVSVLEGHHRASHFAVSDHPVMATTRTGVDGRFVLHDIGAGACTLLAWSTTHHWAGSEEADLVGRPVPSGSADVKSITVNLRTGVIVRGSVHQSDGGPASGLYLKATSSPIIIRTRHDGSFETPPLFGTQVRLQFCDRFLSGELDNVETIPSPVRLIAVPAGVVRGRVVGADGTAINGVQVSLRGSAARARRTTSAFGGAFQFERVRPGSVEVEVGGQTLRGIVVEADKVTQIEDFAVDSRR